ncbi:uncharacterized protein LOC143862752 isoform X1 [Tasmannia lanceolata]|uniref:uncharacterized protein LOC143862752 isoform X1 n=1 Tax=Tasmannia lanceolata TaxID=3420 RepID=UPI0040637E9E
MMELANIPSIRVCQKTSQCSNQAIFEEKDSLHSLKLKLKPICKKSLRKAYAPFDFQLPLTQNGLCSSRNRPFSTVTYASKNSESGEEDHKALETVLKLYTAIKDRNLQEVSDLIGEECRIVCNFFPFLLPLEGKKQVLAFFASLMGIMGKRVEFVIQPTPDGGMNVGVHWRFEIDNTAVPFGKGYSIYTCHIYDGRMIIRDVHTIIEPLVHMKHIPPILIGVVTPILLAISSLNIFKSGWMRSFKYCFLTVFFIITLFSSWRQYRKHMKSNVHI